MYFLLYFFIICIYSLFNSMILLVSFGHLHYYFKTCNSAVVNTSKLSFFLCTVVVQSCETYLNKCESILKGIYYKFYQLIILLKGSKVANVSNSLLPNDKKLREDNKSKLKNNILQTDIVLKSLSKASHFVTGCNVNQKRYLKRDE